MIRYILSVTAIGVVWTLWPLTFIIPFWLFIFPSFIWIAWIFHSSTPFGVSGNDIKKLVKATEDKTTKEQLADTTLIRDVGAEA